MSLEVTMPNLKEVFAELSGVGSIIADRAEKNRSVTIVKRGTMNQYYWNLVPQKLANGLCVTVYFSVLHPDRVILVNGGPLSGHVSKREILNAIGKKSKGFQVIEVTGEDHPEIPFSISVLDHNTPLVLSNMI